MLQAIKTVSVLLLGIGLISACQSVEPASSDVSIAAPAQSSVAVESEVEGRRINSAPATNTSSRAPDIQLGTGSFFDEQSKHSSGPHQKQTGKSFVFDEAPIRAVINEIISEAFGQDYAIDPSVTGTISLSLNNLTNIGEAIAGLNRVLAFQGYRISRSDGVYVINEAGRGEDVQVGIQFLEQGDVLRGDTGVAVLKLQYARTGDVIAIAQSILPSDALRFDDDTRGLVVVSGDRDTVLQAAELIRSLDVDWLSAISTALIPVEFASPSDIAREAEPIIARLGGVSVVPIERLRSLMILSRTRQALIQTKDWVHKLDRSAGPKLYDDLLVYEVKYADAVDLAALAEGTQRSTPRAPSIDTRGSIPGTTSQPIERRTNSPTSVAGSSVSIQVDEGQNAIVARGPREDLASLSSLLTTLDRPRRQVLIEATIVEVSLTDSRSLGIEWDAIEDQLSATLSDDASRPVASLFPGLSVSYINADLSAVVNALAQSSEVEVISSPRMVVLNNETARLQIGDQVPIITQSAVSITDPGAPVVNSTIYRDTGIILTVKPSVRAGGMVEIEIAQEVSGVAETTTSNIDSPTIYQRSLESVLDVPDGATAVLGGLMSSTRSVSDSGVPYLKDVPLLGTLFRSESLSDRRTELIILIKPTVVLGDAPLVTIPQRLAQALDAVREPRP